jgi:hypothetical protein
MRTLIVSSLAVFAVLAVMAQTASADSINRSFYDKSGSFAGSSVSRGNSDSFYDKSGRFSGSSIQHGNQRSFYDGSGRYSGSTTITSPRR